MRNRQTQNQGEGDRRSARRYNEKATAHASSDAPSQAAREARQAIEERPRRHAAAERAGKARAAELDPEVTMPSWWVDRERTTWARIKAAFHRDWEQTKANLSGGYSGEELDQGLVDTLKQMIGSQAVPPEGEPVGVHLDVARDPVASRAFELGYNAAGHVTGEWNPNVETILSDAWQRIEPGAFWADHRASAYLGWRHRRRYPDLSRNGTL